MATARGGDLAAARPHFVAAVGEASAHHNVGTLLLRAGDRDAAEAEFRQAVAKDPGTNPEMKKAHAALAALTAGRNAAHLAAAGPAAANRPAAVTPAAATAPPADPFAPSRSAAPAVTAAYAAPAAEPAPGLPPFGAAAAPDMETAAGPEVPPPWPF